MNHRHADFQSAALPLSYSGYAGKPRGSAAYREAMRPLASAKSVALTHVYAVFVIGKRPRYSVTLAEPLQQIAVLAALATKWRKCGQFRFFTQWTKISFARHAHAHSR